MYRVKLVHRHRTNDVPTLVKSIFCCCVLNSIFVSTYYDMLGHNRTCLFIPGSSHSYKYSTLYLFLLNITFGILRTLPRRHRHLERPRGTTSWNIIASPQGRTQHDARSLSTYVPRGGQSYDVVALGIQPLEVLIPFFDEGADSLSPRGSKTCLAHSLSCALFSACICSRKSAGAFEAANISPQHPLALWTWWIKASKPLRNKASL